LKSPPAHGFRPDKRASCHLELFSLIRQRIHKRMLAYDGMAVHPDIGFYGNVGNREWKQSALPDDNEAEAGACPLQNQPPQ
jgi:FPC/CPF motif-containing protein YcgG